MIRGYFDGASRGNPGEAGAGAVIYDDDSVVWRRAEPLGICTNNEAEYTALRLLLEEFDRRKVRGAVICGDSKLVIMQVTGAWKIRVPRLRVLAEPLIDLIGTLGVRCRWVPREQNAEADRLSNWALDKGRLIEDLTAVEPAAPAHAESRHARKMIAEPVGAAIWLVRDGDEEFAVDTAHHRCTCADGNKGQCRHFAAVAERCGTAGADR